MRQLRDPLLLIVIGVIVGVIVALHHPRDGMNIVCGSLAVAALLRAVLRPRDAGSLVVRGRRTDIAVLAALAVAIGVFAAVTPFHGAT